jgi:hypothetical protein
VNGYQKMMHKKISHIIISLVLLVSTMGLTIDKHYCGDRLVSVSIFDEPDSCCDMTGDCCHDDSETYKLSVDYTLSHLNIDFDQAPIVLPALSSFYISFFDVVSSDAKSTVFIPPRNLRTALSIIQTYRL